MKKLLFVSIFALSVLGTASLKAAPGLSETTVDSKATASVELLGAGLLYSVFGSYRFIPELAVNLGVSFSSANGSTNLLIPMSLSFLAGGKNGHHFELLGGGSIVTGSYTGTGISTGTVSGFLPTFGAGYRYWPSEGGFHFRGTLYGFISNGFLPWFGLSFGYAFS
ncbi:MAG: hypothetical protein R3B54_12370 [Bdellovibrionota bacterium]